ncbi:unnamed protein product [Hermetia illucens]|uniref:MATH domain-containing protein n=1 Tax=Hermetia illucens TaxID=343691 RepID=A0A7R8USQ8_HERIL|nr:speckle-type POZ protein-like [Hermetia illucens]XP_037911750.1 speckle-type POZ protein-like [Hermetia illucens]XP_037911751.1 speckle-type POZ protein-like [Hermetia illucens]CAD7086358.1 unnamed protein product [Hermetia illucens]
MPNHITREIHTAKFTSTDFFQMTLRPYSAYLYCQSEFDARDIKGTIKLYPRGCCEENKNWLSLYVLIKRDPRAEVQAKVSFYLKKANQTRGVVSQTGQYHLIFHPHALWHVSHLIRTETVLDPSEGYLTKEGQVQIDISIEVRVNRTPSRFAAPPIYEHREEVLQTLKNEAFLETCDMEFLVEGKVYRTHRWIIMCNASIRFLLQELGNNFDGPIPLPTLSGEDFEDLAMECYMVSNRFCKKCFHYRGLSDQRCCSGKWRANEAD